MANSAQKLNWSKKDIASEFSIPASTLSTILKNQTIILKQLYSGDTRKRKRNVKFSDLKEAVVKWFQQWRDNNVSPLGILVKEKAEVFAKKLDYVDFRASDGWLDCVIQHIIKCMLW